MDLSKLNNEQLKAVKLTEGPVMAMAGAGSGKTRVLTYRIAYLISELGVSPESILAVTFTNKAAREMQERVSKLLDTKINGMWVSTFHSFGARMLRVEITKLPGYRRDFIIIDDDDAEKLVKKIIKEHELDVTYKPALQYISLVKNEEHIPKIFNDTPEFKSVYNYYQEALMKDNLVDFDDLLRLPVEIFRTNIPTREKYRNMFNYILIDEFQDTNKLQYELVNLLVNDNKNIFIVGDINQSIYSFRGARVSNVSEFYNLYKPAIVKLEQNYRSTKTILNAANDVISKNSSFVDMKLFTEGAVGEKIALYDADSSYGEVIYIINEIKKLIAAGSSFKDIAIIYRLNSLSLGFETEFVKAKIPYIVYGGVGYFERREVKDVIAYLRVVLNSKDDFSFRRIVNVPKRKIGDKLIESLTEHAGHLNLSLYEAIDSFGNQLLINFKKIIEELKGKLEKVDLIKLIELILDKTGYLQMLEDEDEDARIDNVYELKSIMKDLMETHDGETNEKILTDFLLDLALKTDVDNVKEDDNKVKLMNYHQAKGLEYKIVFMPAMEEGIFPPFQSLSDHNEMEEERRICYVGITRAMERLYLTHASVRRLYGKDNPYSLSEFVRDISSEYIASKKNYNREYKAISQGYYVPASKKVEEKQDDTGYKAGDKIMHKVFGKGRIVAKSGDKITVAFSAEFGIKILLASHPSITKLGDEEDE